eukprot:CAMPEP_0174258318 /NCGR_PEP_ID=MMETSP0439-20130205/7323_1 /TAXON_ID=0 /ORGANISM="Stereomyxa ramosa, Strain Chinc5" /LENGTH=410 /DNA_ID=CAMNT_0015341773 /DNA_START=136 /DNA_END=1368 /DNA_ORIENTATION=-
MYSGLLYTDLVPIDADALRNQNGHTYLRHSLMMDIFGAPCPFETNCQSVTNPKLKPLIVLESVGNFRVTGMKPAVDALRRALDNLKKDYPVNGKLDPRADGKAQYGLTLLAPYMNEQGFFWAAGYSPAYEDAMHFEISDQTMQQWAVLFAEGVVDNTTTSQPPAAGDCTWTIVKKGDNSKLVKVVQYLLLDNGISQVGSVDGIFGSGTEAATKAFQSAKGLAADGIVGPVTWGSLFGESATISRGSSRLNAVKAIQELLSITVDGIFGSGTESGVKTFQNKIASLSPTGTVDLATFRALAGNCPKSGKSKSNSTSKDTEEEGEGYEGMGLGEDGKDSTANTSATATGSSISNDDDGLSSGAIAGIVVGSLSGALLLFLLLLAVVVLGVVSVVVLKKRKAAKAGTPYSLLA